MEHWRNLSLKNIVELVEGVGWVCEEWKDIEGYENLYKASTFGRIKSMHRTVSHPICIKKTIPERIRRLSMQKNGYLLVDLSLNGIKETRSVHEIVASTFIENQENKPTVNHKKGIKTDNRVQMLEWFTSKEQDSHARSIGLKIPIKGEECSFTKLKDMDVLNIFNSNLGHTELGEMYKVSPSVICAIKKGRRRTYLTGAEYAGKRKLTDVEILGIFNSNISLRKTAKLYRVQSTTVFNIKHGIRYSMITGKTDNKT